jgi:hypothetical protein
LKTNPKHSVAVCEEKDDRRWRRQEMPTTKTTTAENKAEVRKHMIFLPYDGLFMIVPYG